MGKNQLVQAFLLLAAIVILTGTGLIIYFDGQVPPEMKHGIEVVK